VGGKTTKVTQGQGRSSESSAALSRSRWLESVFTMKSICCFSNAVLCGEPTFQGDDRPPDYLQ